LTPSELRARDAEVTVSALSVLLLLDAMVFMYDRSKTWWRNRAWRRPVKGLTAPDA